MSDGAVGVVLVGHGRTASELLQAAIGIIGAEALEGVVAVDAGKGETERLGQQLCDVIAKVDQGTGVLVLADLWGASPCSCARREALAAKHDTVTLAGLNLAMLLKLGGLDRTTLGAQAVADACAEAGQRAVKVIVEPKPEPSTSTKSQP